VRLCHFLDRRKIALRNPLSPRSNVSNLHTDSPFDNLRLRYQTTVQFKSSATHAGTTGISDAGFRAPTALSAAEIVSPACTRHHIDADTFHTSDALPLHPIVFLFLAAELDRKATQVASPSAVHRPQIRAKSTPTAPALSCLSTRLFSFPRRKPRQEGDTNRVTESSKTAHQSSVHDMKCCHGRT